MVCPCRNSIIVPPRALALGIIQKRVYFSSPQSHLSRSFSMPRPMCKRFKFARFLKLYANKILNLRWKSASRPYTLTKLSFVSPQSTVNNCNDNTIRHCRQCISQTRIFVNDVDKPWWIVNRCRGGEIVQR